MRCYNVIIFTCIILIGSGITLFSYFHACGKKRLHDYRTDLKESKGNLIKVIEDAELLVSEMNNFAEYIVTQIEEKNESLLSNIAEADLRIDMLSSLPVPTIEAEKYMMKNPCPGFLKKKAAQRK